MDDFEKKESQYYFLRYDEKLAATLFVVIGITLIVLLAVVIWQAVVVRQLKTRVDTLNNAERYEIVQAVVVDYDLDNMLLFVANDTDDEQVVVEVLLKETEASVTVAAEMNMLIGRQVAYLSWQNEKVLLTIFTPQKGGQNANTVVY